MANRFEQSTPPSIHDVYRGLPIGPGGVEPFIYRDRGRHRRGPASLPWRSIIEALRYGFRHIRNAFRPSPRSTVSGGGRPFRPERVSGTCP